MFQELVAQGRTAVSFCCNKLKLGPGYSRFVKSALMNTLFAALFTDIHNIYIYKAEQQIPTKMIEKAVEPQMVAV